MVPLPFVRAARLRRKKRPSLRCGVKDARLRCGVAEAGAGLVLGAETNARHEYSFGLSPRALDVFATAACPELCERSVRIRTSKVCVSTRRRCRHPRTVAA